MTAELKASRHDATLILTLTTHDPHNILHPEIAAAAIETLSTAERDDSIKAVVLTGLNHFFPKKKTAPESQKKRAGWEDDHVTPIAHLDRWIDALRDCSKLVVASLDGEMSGFGLSLGLACDLIVAGTSTCFDVSQLDHEFDDNGVGIRTIAQELPRQLAMEILTSAQPVASKKLHEFGLINRIVSDGTALDIAIAWANELTSISPGSIAKIKELLHERSDLDRR